MGRKTPRDRLKVLKRRRDFLAGLDDDERNSWDRQELAALKWAVWKLDIVLDMEDFVGSFEFVDASGADAVEPKR